MAPKTPLPYGGTFSSAQDYVDALLDFAWTTDLFQILCGGVHILDFFTSEPELYYAVLPEEWHKFLLSYDIMRVLDLLLRDDLDRLDFAPGQGPPEDLLAYIKSVRAFSMRRDFEPPERKLPVLPRSAVMGMKPKKVHEVTNFAAFIDRLSRGISNAHGGEISHFVDLGSGQNYLGRILASDAYNRHVVAVESRDTNVAAARDLDRMSGLVVRQKVMRNKKLWNKILEIRGSAKDGDPEALGEVMRQVAGSEAFDFRPAHQLSSEYKREEGKGQVQYVSGRLDSGDLAEIIAKLDGRMCGEGARNRPRLMAISIHSCGNLSHHGIRSLIVNPDIRAIAIVGCCYNLMTEKLGPLTYKHAYLRPTLQALNGRVFRESDKHDAQGFPMSNRFSTYRGQGIRLNITARMMACQAPLNWSREDSEAFFTRHFYRAVLQRMFLDRGVVSYIRHGPSAGGGATSPFDVSTNPVTIGSLGKQCYGSLRAYVRGAVEKLTSSVDYKQYADVMRDKMAEVTDEEIDKYEALYLPRRPELCVIWSLMAFSAMVVESLIVADRWAFLVEHGEVVEQAWVETVFDYKESPRNLVVVGVKRDDA